MAVSTFIGQRYGRLVVATEPQKRESGRYVGCTCDCGTSRYVLLADLLSGRQRSCGCTKREVTALLRQTDEHGNPKYGATVEYRVWSNAQQKCCNPRCVSYPNNGGRGIKLTAEWATDFVKFYADMGRCPSGYCLVRLDPAGDFSKDNCRWSRSKRGETHEYQGAKRTVASWAAKLNIPIRYILDGLEDGRTLAQIHEEYQEQSVTEVAA